MRLGREHLELRIVVPLELHIVVPLTVKSCKAADLPISSSLPIEAG